MLSLVCFVAFSGLFAKRRNTLGEDCLFVCFDSFAACRTGLWVGQSFGQDAIHRLSQVPSPKQY